MRRNLATVLALATLVATTPLAAQDAPTFHAGQWGAEFIWSGGVYGIGALKFTSESSAWALDASAGAQFHDIADTEDGQSSFGAGVSLARRHYRAATGRVRPFTEIGGRASYNRQKQTSGANEAVSRGLGAGLLAGIGAQIFFTRDMSIGAKWSANFDVTQDRNYLNDTKVGETTHYYFDAGNVSITGALYF